MIILTVKFGIENGKIFIVFNFSGINKGSVDNVSNDAIELFVGRNKMKKQDIISGIINFALYFSIPIKPMIMNNDIMVDM